MQDRNQEHRRQTRYAIDVSVNVHSHPLGLIRGQVLEISESGISAALEAELPLGDQVELEIHLPFVFSNLSTLSATVKHRESLRHGFEFAHLDLAQGLANGSRDA